MSTANYIAQAIFPFADDVRLDYIIWNRTGYPSFWATKEGESIEDCFRRQLMKYRDALKQYPESEMCTFCTNKKVNEWHCEECQKRTDDIHEAEKNKPPV